MNAPSKLSPLVVIIAAIAAIIAIFMVDWWTTVFINISVFYVCVIVILAWSRSLRWMWGLTLVTAILAVFGLQTDSTVRAHTWIETINRYITVLMLLTTASFVHFSILLSRKFLAEVADRRRAEESLRKTQDELAHVSRVTMLGEIGASIAHEISQPLSGVSMNSNASLRWLGADPPNIEEARSALQRIIRDGNLANEVIQRIRTLLKKTKTEKRPLNINEVIQEVVLLAHGEINRKRVSLRTELTRDLPLVVGERVQLQQVLLNLILNGIEAMTEVTDRSRELVITTQTQDDGKVLVSVRDSGAGFGTSDPKKVFDAFYTTKKDGMGMGLSISRSIIQDHDGRLWATENDGPGATFQFTVLTHP